MLASLFRRPLVVAPLAIRPGDDLLLPVPDWPASQDPVAFLNALQGQFPGVRLHLLIGFHADVVRKQGSGDREGAGQHAEPKRTVEQQARQALASGAPTGPQGNVVIWTWSGDGRVVVVSVPPQVQGDAFEQAHGRLPEGVMPDGGTPAREVDA